MVNIIKHNKTKDNRRKRGFTLIELLVVVALILLVAGIALPTVMNLFSAGADAQAYNLLAAQLSYARSQAIFRGKYVGVHVQVSDRDADGNSSINEKTCYSAVVVGELNGGNIEFTLLDKCKPEKIPGNMGFGKLTNHFFSDTVAGNYDHLDELAGTDGFTTDRKSVV